MELILLDPVSNHHTGAVQTCVVHLIRAANRWGAYGDRKAVSAQLRKIYTALTEDTARAALEEFEVSELGVKYPQSAKVWRDAWDRFIPFLQFPPMVRQGDLYNELDRIDEQ